MMVHDKSVSNDGGFMRLSLTKAAHVAVSSAAWQEIRVRSVEKHLHEGSAELQIDSHRSARR
jgi:hypothetical protein